MKETFTQVIRSIDDKPISREQIAKALTNIARDIRRPGRPDSNPIGANNLQFEVHGIAYIGAPDGIINLTIY